MQIRCTICHCKQNIHFGGPCGTNRFTKKPLGCCSVGNVRTCCSEEVLAFVKPFHICLVVKACLYMLLLFSLRVAHMGGGSYVIQGKLVEGGSIQSALKQTHGYI